MSSVISSVTPEEYEWGRWLFCQECTFKLGIQDLSQLPKLTLPEVGFVGRSNVGKSSLINALTGRLALARISHTPGRTQQLNFFELGSRLFLVDMPGYGYAKVSKDLIKSWNLLIKLYLRGRTTLQRVYLLVDARQGLKANDLEMMELLDETAVSYQIVLTKIDKISEQSLQLLLASTERELLTHGAAHPVVMKTSSHKKVGISELQTGIAQLVKRIS